MENQKNPWETVEQKIVYQSPFFTLREDRVVRPDGKPGIYNVFVKGRSNQVVAVTRDGEIYLVGQWRYPTGRYSWELPGGLTDNDETLVETGIRELKEETGLVSERWTNLGRFDILNGHSDGIVDVLVAEDVSQTNENEALDDGIDNMKKVSLKEACAMIQRGEISNPPAISAIFFYLIYAGYLNRL